MQRGEHWPKVRGTSGRAKSQSPSLCCGLQPPPSIASHPDTLWEPRGEAPYSNRSRVTIRRNGVEPESLTFTSDAPPWGPLRVFCLTSSTGGSKALVHMLFRCQEGILGPVVQRTQWPQLLCGHEMNGYSWVTELWVISLLSLSLSFKNL